MFVHCSVYQLNLVLRHLSLFRSAKFSLIRLPGSQYFLYIHYRGCSRLRSLSLDACLNSPHRTSLAEVVSQLRTDLVRSLRSVMNDRSRVGWRNAYFCSKITRCSSRWWLQFLSGIQKYYLKPNAIRNYANQKYSVISYRSKKVKKNSF
jgi:hypothetical protein